jgi:hypothetical protein
LRPLILTFQDYTDLCNAHFAKRTDTARVRQERLYNPNERFFNEGIKKLKGNFMYELAWFGLWQKKVYGKPEYLTYSYTIFTDPRLCSKIAEVTVHFMQDAAYKAMAYKCYKVGKGWKIAMIDEHFIARIDMESSANWIKNYSHQYIEDFPYEAAKKMWLAIVDTANITKENILLTPEEFEKEIYNYYPEWKAYPFKQQYEGYANFTKEKLIKQHDSLMRYPCIPTNFTSDIVYGGQLVNRPGRTTTDVPNLRCNFTFKVPCIVDGQVKKNYIAGVSYCMIPINKGKDWKLILFWDNLHETDEQEYYLQQPTLESYFP